MTFTARIVKKDVSPTIKAIVDVTADGSLAIHGLKLIEGKNGLFLSMPADKWKDTQTGETKHIDIVHPTNADTRAELFKAVKDACSCQKRNNKKMQVLFPKDTVVIDNYYLDP